MPMTSKTTFAAKIATQQPLLVQALQDAMAMTPEKSTAATATELAKVMTDWLKETLDGVFEGIDSTHTAHAHPITAQPGTGTIIGASPSGPVTGTATVTVTGTTGAPAG